MNRSSFDALAVGQLFIADERYLVKIDAMRWRGRDGKVRRANAVTDSGWLQLVPPNQRVTPVDRPGR